MYNSFIVSIFAKAWELILDGYQGSLLKKVVDLGKNILSKLFYGSLVGSFFTSRRSLIEESFFYALARKITDFVNQVIKFLNRYIDNHGKYSLIYRNVKKLFSSEVEILRTFFIFTFSFSIGLIGNNIIRGFYSGRSYIVAILLVIGSLLGLALKEDYKKILNNSWCYGFIIDIFAIDEGGGNWW